MPACTCSSSPSSGEQALNRRERTNFRHELLNYRSLVISLYLLIRKLSEMSQRIKINIKIKRIAWKVSSEWSECVGLLFGLEFETIEAGSTSRRKRFLSNADLGNLDLNLLFTAIHGSKRIQDRENSVARDRNKCKKQSGPATCDVCRSRAPLMLLKLHSITLSALGLT